MDEFLRCAGEIDEHGTFDLTSARWKGDALELRIVLLDDRSEAPTATTWIVSCDRVREHKLTLGWAEAIQLSSDHPLLWPHRDLQASLYFSGPPAEPQQLLGQLWTCHERLVGRWLPLSRFVNQPSALAALLAAGHGLLARAPEPLLDAYAEVLDRAGVPWSISGRYEPRSWSDARGYVVSNSRSQPSALTLDEAYVVAERFAATREFDGAATGG